MMRVVVAGATGAIGRPLVHELVAAGHQVIGLSRSPASSEAVTSLGAEVVSADAIDCDGLLRAVEGRQADAIIHQANLGPCS